MKTDVRPNEHQKLILLKLPYFDMFANPLEIIVLSSIMHDMAPYFFRCDSECDMTNVFAASIVLLFTFTIFAIQIHLAKEHETLRTFTVRSKLRNDTYYLLYQMRMLQPIAYEKRIITEQEKNQITSIVKTIKQIEDNLNELKDKLGPEEKKKITQTIDSVKQRLRYGINDLKRHPQRFDYMDFSESIKDISNTLPIIS
ncbi:MAG: hypothetical protein DWQ18_03770 [Crenarchaeota archaeon]|nr:MAG: hypothetical protein DWQ17_09360 [Thermoproteota archaeon]RDJ34030.1 MAG: hypothetical protein DWQ18_03770 [Thermoproteota archaeon]RDJ36855.1 MAG: hypothetical protein DWQ13_06845 [Thermoproteota archaeon]RDJ37610.1 MAG: hypothetical protein DWQ19_03990 [Thermoproteota archaeon]